MGIAPFTVTGDNEAGVEFFFLSYNPSYSVNHFVLMMTSIF